ncbi:SCO7613 C-terminal domain-containing membrane protein [Geodermatophilus sabuli]|uniref:DUF2157 domain-containing protein n=1 Tax=Geodermatophilus sabuli TaxID=1564158 RepID=A0A285E9Z0_9ACTN|nr:hypothetical protein [Geodermatophilus sabuli]MBB3085641.1 hypothetical protein [Geodermatophilus sabuli]SNX95939.1 hypothetical protein SAMN06893097_103108 [Geodermatophilus sabuli]
MTSPNGTPWGVPCPVCGRPSAGPGPAPCPSCGLPAVGEAALVVARIGATIDQLARDRDRLLATLRSVAGSPPGPAGPRSVPWSGDLPPVPAAPLPPAAVPPPPWSRPPRLPPGAPAPGAGAAGHPAARRRVSPQQVLLGLGALLVVAAAIAFVAVAWTRLGLAFQATVMLAVTASACGLSAWTGRKGLRATEEALAAAGAALLAVDLGAAHALGLAGADAVPLRIWTALSCAVVVGVAAGLARLRRSTVTWPLVAVLAAQPVALLLLPPGAVGGTAGAAVALAVALLDVLLPLALRPALQPVARVLALLWTFAGAGLGVAAAWSRPPVDSWSAAVLIAAAGALTLLLLREPRLAATLPRAWVLAGAGAGVAALALSGAMARAGGPGPVAAAALGVALLGAGVLTAHLHAVAAASTAAGTALAVTGSATLLVTERPGALAVVVLGATVPAALSAARLPALRPRALAASLACPAAAALLAQEAGWLGLAATGLLLALVGAAGFGLAALWTPSTEERVTAGTGLLAGLCALATTAGVQAWGQAALVLAVTGAAAGAYALAAHRRDVAVGAVAALVAAAWTAVGGAGVATPEAYTLPAAGGLLLLAVPQLRDGARSWAAEGPAVVTALAPSALMAVAEPSALRLVLVVAGATAFAVAGTLTRRQAPFVVGAAALATVVLGRLTPYAPLAPRWLVLAAAGLILLVLGATYERRRQQAREAVAWVAQMR